jgi:hypothetical protein
MCFVAFSAAAFGQFKDQTAPKIKANDGIISTENYGGSSLFGFINPNNFHMSHTYSLSYTAMGSNGIAIGEYTNSMRYDFTKNFNVQVDASLVNTPYSSFGSGVADQINGVYLSRAQLNYKPTDNTFITVQYSNRPYNYFNDNYYWNSFYRDSFWNNSWNERE